MIAIHGSAALRRKQSTLDALDPRIMRQDDDAADRAVGDASQAVVSFYLAVDAAKRYCRANDEPGPFGRKLLTEIAAGAEDMRHAVMHWNSKANRNPDSAMEINGRGMGTLAPKGLKGSDSHIVAIEWKDFERFASRLRTWALYIRDEVAG